MQKIVGKLKRFFKDWPQTKDNVGWLKRQTKPFWRLIACMLAVDVVSALVGVGSSVVGKTVIDSATAGRDLADYIFLMVGMTLFSIVMSAVTGVIATYINEKLAFGVRGNVFAHVLRGGWRDLTKFHSGDLMTRLTSDVGTVSSGVASFIPGILLMAVRLGAAFVVLFQYDRALAVFALILGPAGVLLGVLFTERLKEYSLKLKQSESDYRSYMQETLANMTLVKAFQREDAAAARVNALRAERMALMLKQSRLSAVMNVCMRVVFSLGYVVAFCWGAYRLKQGDITYGTMTLFITLSQQIQGSIMGLGRMFPQFIGIMTSVTRVREVYELSREVPGGREGVPGSVGLRMRDVSFRYDEDSVLRSVTLDIRPGDAVGIVGYSGSGKTTLIRLALALVSRDAGDMIYYGQGFEEEASMDARRFIAYVPQGNSLLSGSIRENLLTGNPDASDEDMWAALAVADADAFVRKLEGGLDAPVGERAGGLSEGQAQRIAIARAVIRNSPFLILDEATSALDEKTESRVLERICKNERQTAVIITHRRSMLAYCNRALEIEDETVHEIAIE